LGSWRWRDGGDGEGGGDKREALTFASLLIAVEGGGDYGQSKRRERERVVGKGIGSCPKKG
jgi:hypothetical protein